VAALCYETINRSPFITPGFEAELPAQLRAAAAAGFEYAGIDLPSLEQHLQTGASLPEVAELLARLELPCFELQPLIVSVDEAYTVGQAERFAEAARALGAAWVQCGLGGELGLDMAAAFRRAAEIIGGAGAALALEYLPFAPIRGIEETRAFLAEAGAPGAKIVVDSWHFFHGPDDWAALEGLALDELAYPQFNDHPEIATGDLMQETVQRRALPGQGVFELERFVRTLRDKGYAGPVSVEILSAELREHAPEQFAREVFAAASPFWA